MDINYQHLLEIDITPDAAEPTYKELGAGIDNLSIALNEVLVQTSYLSDNGWGSTEVTGGQLTLNLTGHRVVGDEAQDYCFSSDVMYAFGAARKTTLRYTDPSGRQVIWPVTLANLTPGGGAANNGSAITINIHGNGKPSVIEGGEVIGQLTVVSVPGELSGDTSIYVNPALEAGHSYVYKTGASVDIPAYDADLSAWIDWDGTSDITATTGYEIVIAEVDASDKAKKAGKAIVTAKA